MTALFSDIWKLCEITRNKQDESEVRHCYKRGRKLQSDAVIYKKKKQKKENHTLSF